MTLHLVKKFEANSTFNFAARWIREDGVPYVLDDAVLGVKMTDEDTDYIIEASVLNGLIIISPEVDGCWAEVRIQPADMAGISYFGGAVWDMIVRRQEDGEWNRLVEGTAIISKGVAHGS